MWITLLASGQASGQSAIIQSVSEYMYVVSPKSAVVWTLTEYLYTIKKK